LSGVRPPDANRRVGVLAFGDSITNGGGELQWGVALQSWALWVARGLGLPFTTYAVDGATVGDVLAAQIPAYGKRNAYGDATYEVGCLYIGVNDVRALDWDAARFEERFELGLAFLAQRCDRVLTATAPLDLGVPRAGAKMLELNAAIERVAVKLGALVVDLRGFRARNYVMADRVHPTALGQIAIAERALDVLEGDGMKVMVRPSSLVYYEIGRRDRLRSDAAYSYRSLKEWAKAARTLAIGRYLQTRGSDKRA
jgi:lysophospholipase L1-like esterase